MDGSSADVPKIVTQQLVELAADDPSKAAFVFWDKDGNRTVMTRKEVLSYSSKCAAIFERAGIEKGDIVCNTLPNCRERIITHYGTLLAGAASMHGQTFLASGEDIIRNWKDSACKAVIVDGNSENGASKVLETLKYVDNETGETCYKDLPALKLVVPIRLSYNQFREDSWLHGQLVNETGYYMNQDVSTDDVAVVFTTSGSTGFAKLVPHTYKSLYEIEKIAQEIFHIEPDTVYFNHRSLGWIGGSPLFYVINGCTRVLFDLSVGASTDWGKSIVNVLEHEHCDVCFLVPSDMLAIWEYINKEESGCGGKLQHKLKYLGTGGGPVSQQQMYLIGSVTEKVTAMYGSTEIGVITSLDVSNSNMYENNCNGTPAKGVLVKVCDEHGNEVPLGTKGEIYLCLHTRANGYLNNAEETDKVFLKDNWYRTSDIGHVNDKGQIFVYCRLSNAINHNGYLHYPGWIESALNKHPKIQKSVAVGIPNPDTYEDLCVCVIPTPNEQLTESEVKEFCKQMFMSEVSQCMVPLPEYVEFMEAVPTNTNGKLDRKKLRSLILERIGLKGHNNANETNDVNDVNTK